jgi:hypothetical protein
METTHTDTTGQLTNAHDAVRYILAGRATVTLVSQKTGQRYTYKVTAPKKGSPSTRFVSLLRGSNNEGDYTYMGAIFGGERFTTTPKSRVAQDAPSYRAFNWALGKLLQGVVPENLEIWHSGCCGKCGRKLTVPESIASGLGPVCARGGLDG